MSSYRSSGQAIILDDSSDSEASSSHNDSFGLNDDTDESIQISKNDRSTKQRPILIDSSDEEDNGGEEENIESCMKSLNLAEARTGTVEAFKSESRPAGTLFQPSKSQLSSLNFDSSSEESGDEDMSGSESEKENDHKVPARAINRRAETIELLDTDSEDDEVSDNAEGSNDSDSSLLSPTASPEVFKMKTPSPSNSALSSNESEEGNESSLSVQTGEFASVDGDNDTAWKRNKLGVYILKGKCTIAGDVQWPKINIPKKLYNKLYDHQKVGVQWMASLHTNGIGGILGDDMGLGKTFQTCTLLGGLMRSRVIRNALIICPVVVMKTWEREMKLILEQYCGVKVSIRIVDSSIKRERRAMLLEEALRW